VPTLPAPKLSYRKRAVNAAVARIKQGFDEIAKGFDSAQILFSKTELRVPGCSFFDHAKRVLVYASGAGVKGARQTYMLNVSAGTIHHMHRRCQPSAISGNDSPPSLDKDSKNLYRQLRDWEGCAVILNTIVADGLLVWGADAYYIYDAAVGR
jgi:hypothetical protein